jgi:hypothetical protein
MSLACVSRPAVVFALVLGVGGCGASQRLAECATDEDCPIHQGCVQAACITGCLNAGSCGAGFLCDPHGRCIALFTRDGGDHHDLAGIDLGTPDLAQPVDLDLGPPPRDLTVRPDLWQGPDLLAGCSGVACPEQYGNNSLGTATLINDNLVLSGQAVCPQGDVDYYKLVGSKKGTVTARIQIGPCGWPLVVDIMNEMGAIIGSSMSTTTGAQAQATVTNNGVLYIRVQGQQAAGTNYYDLSVSNQ